MNSFFPSGREVSAESSRKNRSQRNLRDKHHRPTAASQRRAHGPNVNFSFATAGNAVQQERRKRTFGDC